MITVEFRHPFRSMFRRYLYKTFKLRKRKFFEMEFYRTNILLGLNITLFRAHHTISTEISIATITLGMTIYTI